MWTRIGMTALGIWLMSAPGIFGFEKHISNSAHIVGPLIATFAIISLSEATRNVRLLCIPLALWLLAAPWVLQYDNTTALINDYAVAILLFLLSIVKPK